MGKLNMILRSSPFPRPRTHRIQASQRGAFGFRVFVLMFAEEVSDHHQAVCSGIQSRRQQGI